ncbi:Peptidase C1A papain C-terminal [Arabidopsis suecica]|uniref:Peptidase C1A papain C-terminal n=1 Tax=Arabidopsis suecica TaxID=45249 RepID=A0A8T2FD41_ARASU|nr:Peptidase C1A papain C-terminal [Arabidopsis suecica]
MEELPIKVEILYESDQLFSELMKIGQYIPLSTFLEILKLKLDGKFEILRVKNKVVKPKVEGETIDVVYTRLRKHQVLPDETKKADWGPFYGPVKDQGEHDICWAIVTAELVTAIRWIKQHENGTEYSYQELVDFVFPEKGKLQKKRHISVIGSAS